MASSQILSNSSLIFLITCLLNLLCLFDRAYCLRPKHFNLSTKAIHWGKAGATWYGSPNGAGTTGGACGYGNAVLQAPFSSMTAAISPSLYLSGKECGACYQVKCTKHPSCSGKPVRVVAIDLCPGGPCLAESAHFDLSGTSISAMAKPGQGKKLRDAGILQIKFARVACDYPGKKIAFRVDMGSNPNYIAFVVEFEDGDGDLGRVEIKEKSRQWRVMQQSWGAVWKLDAGGKLKPPFSIRLTSRYSGQRLVAKNVIPSGWEPGSTYRSLVNYR